MRLRMLGISALILITAALLTIRYHHAFCGTPLERIDERIFHPSTGLCPAYP